MHIPEPDSLFDAAIAVQVLEYVPDTEAALTELYRVLRPGGRLVIWDADWSTVSMHSSDQDRMLRVLHAWDDHLAHPELPHMLARQLRDAGFSEVTADGTAFVTTTMDHESYGGSMVPLIGNYVAGHRGVSKEDAHEWLAEQVELDEAGAFFFACLQVCFTAVHAG
jgi:arsenite methyltransferase